MLGFFFFLFFCGGGGSFEYFCYFCVLCVYCYIWGGRELCVSECFFVFLSKYVYEI